MKKLLLLLLISFYSFAQTGTILNYNVSTANNSLTGIGKALGITGTITGPGGTIKGLVGLLDVSTSSGSSINTSTLLGSVQHKGTVYNKSSWTDYLDFTILSANTSIVGGNKIRISGSVGFLDINNTTTIDENVRYSLRYIVGSISGTSSGPAPVIRSLSTAVGVPVSAYCPINTTTGSGITQLSIGFTGVTTVIGKIVGSPVTAGSGDEIEILLEVDGNYLKASSRNLSQTNSNISTAIYDYVTGGLVTGPPNTFNYSVQPYGGVSTITSINISSNDLINLFYIFEGDSKIRGIGASGITYNRFQNRLLYYYQNKTGLTLMGTEGGTGDRSDNILSRTTSTIAKVRASGNVVFMPSSNDARNGVAFSTWAANTKATINAYTAAGLNVMLMNMIPELSVGGIDLSTQAAWINTISGPNISIIDSWGFSKNPSNNFIVASFTGDGIHPNDAWHYAFSTYLIRLKTFERYYEFYETTVNTPPYTSYTNFSMGRIGFPPAISGTNNYALGDYAGASMSSGNSNTFMGNYAGGSNSSGSFNFFAGYQAGQNNTSGSSNTYIGNGAGAVNIAQYKCC